MSSPAVRDPAPSPRGFAHDAYFYDDLSSFVTEVGGFVADGLEAGESVLVATDAAKSAALRDHLDDPDGVTFLDMAGVGRNPGRIIPVWRSFVADANAAGRGARGVGEPVWDGRSAAELAECRTHELLLNLAFDDGPSWSLLCPYDTASLSDAVLEDALRTHPAVVVDSARRASSLYRGPDELDALLVEVLAEPLREPTAPVVERPFAGDGLSALRDEVTDRARRSGVSRERLEDLALAVHELATNSVRHGGGGGVARMWDSGDAFVVEIADTGHILDPLAGRTRAPLGADGGRGLWMAHQLGDLVELRTSPAGTVIRFSLSTRDPSRRTS